MSNTSRKQAYRSELLVLNQLIFQAYSIRDVVNNNQRSASVSDLVE